ncbi:hypothetical protein [Deinococcus marmoris]|uniref:hypothetical protein n=1 Tax=Deinococcus marmoris TaxID=249408 RepID=UPI000495BAC7|nr:hypothetical protein [Deinococcus marmoris]
METYSVSVIAQAGLQFDLRSPQKTDRYEARVFKLRAQSGAYRQRARELGLSKNTLMEIVHRHR